MSSKEPPGKGVFRVKKPPGSQLEESVQLTLKDRKRSVNPSLSSPLLFPRPFVTVATQMSSHSLQERQEKNVLNHRPTFSSSFRAVLTRTINSAVAITTFARGIEESIAHSQDFILAGERREQAGLRIRPLEKYLNTIRATADRWTTAIEELGEPERHAELTFRDRYFAAILVDYADEGDEFSIHPLDAFLADVEHDLGQLRIHSENSFPPSRVSEARSSRSLMDQAQERAPQEGAHSGVPALAPGEIVPHGIAPTVAIPKRKVLTSTPTQLTDVHSPGEIGTRDKDTASTSRRTWCSSDVRSFPGRFPMSRSVSPSSEVESCPEIATVIHSFPTIEVISDPSPSLDSSINNQSDDRAETGAEEIVSSDKHQSAEEEKEILKECKVEETQGIEEENIPNTDPEGSTSLNKELALSTVAWLLSHQVMSTNSLPVDLLPSHPRPFTTAANEEKTAEKGEGEEKSERTHTCKGDQEDELTKVQPGVLPIDPVVKVPSGTAPIMALPRGENLLTHVSHHMEKTKALTADSPTSHPRPFCVPAKLEKKAEKAEGEHHSRGPDLAPGGHYVTRGEQREEKRELTPTCKGDHKEEPMKDQPIALPGGIAPTTAVPQGKELTSTPTSQVISDLDQDKEHSSFPIHTDPSSKEADKETQWNLVQAGQMQLGDVYFQMKEGENSEREMRDQYRLSPARPPSSLAPFQHRPPGATMSGIPWTEVSTTSLMREERREGDDTGSADDCSVMGEKGGGGRKERSECQGEDKRSRGEGPTELDSIWKDTGQSTEQRDSLQPQAHPQGMMETLTRIEWTGQLPHLSFLTDIPSLQMEPGKTAETGVTGEGGCQAEFENGLLRNRRAMPYEVSTPSTGQESVLPTTEKETELNDTLSHANGTPDGLINFDESMDATNTGPRENRVEEAKKDKDDPHFNRRLRKERSHHFLTGEIPLDLTLHSESATGGSKSGAFHILRSLFLIALVFTAVSLGESIPYGLLITCRPTGAIINASIGCGVEEFSQMICQTTSSEDHTDSATSHVSFSSALERLKYQPRLPPDKTLSSRTCCALPPMFMSGCRIIPHCVPIITISLTGSITCGIFTTITLVVHLKCLLQGNGAKILCGMWESHCACWRGVSRIVGVIMKIARAPFTRRLSRPGRVRRDKRRRAASIVRPALALLALLAMALMISIQSVSNRSDGSISMECSAWEGRRILRMNSSMEGAPRSITLTLGEGEFSFKMKEERLKLRWIKEVEKEQYEERFITEGNCAAVFRALHSTNLRMNSEIARECKCDDKEKCTCQSATISTRSDWNGLSLEMFILENPRPIWKPGLEMDVDEENLSLIERCHRGRVIYVALTEENQMMREDKWDCEVKAKEAQGCDQYDTRAHVQFQRKAASKSGTIPLCDGSVFFIHGTPAMVSSRRLHFTTSMVNACHARCPNGDINIVGKRSTLSHLAPSHIMRRMRRGKVALIQSLVPQGKLLADRALPMETLIEHWNTSSCMSMASTAAIAVARIGSLPPASRVRLCFDVD